MIAFFIILVGFGLFLFSGTQEVAVGPSGISSTEANVNTTSAGGLPPLPEATVLNASSTNVGQYAAVDLSNQPHLINPPSVVKAVYVTAWSAGSKAKINYIVGLIKRTELNAVVIDIKDYSGHISYKTSITEVNDAGASGELRIPAPNALIKQLHDDGIYVIGRITVFQDPILAKAHPEWALKNRITGKTWVDRKGLAWMDPAAKPVWDYNLSIAKDALARGFDEVNFDYIRFASDGDLSQISYPYWDGKTPYHKVIAGFFKYLRENLPDYKISIDLFGLSTINTDDLGIGQVIEDAYKYFDFVCPMVYPSHYAAGFIGYQNPAEHPYEVIKYSLEHALNRVIALSKIETATTAATSSGPTPSVLGTADQVLPSSPTVPVSKIRPWLQDFDLGAIYDASMVRKEIQAVGDVLGSATSSDEFVGWLLWDPANTYTEGALQTSN